MNDIIYIYHHGSIYYTSRERWDTVNLHQKERRTKLELLNQGKGEGFTEYLSNTRQVLHNIFLTQTQIILLVYFLNQKRLLEQTLNAALEYHKSIFKTFLYSKYLETLPLNHTHIPNKPDIFFQKALNFLSYF